MNDSLIRAAAKYAADFLRELATSHALPLGERAAVSVSGPAGGGPHGGSHPMVNAAGSAVGESEPE